jgi:AcrR family transcriptional regulator
MPGQRAPEETRREQILRAAYQIAAEQGIDGFTIRLVASAAGLSSGLVLFHYKSKERLLTALLDWLLSSTLVPPTLSPVPATRPAFERLLDLLWGEMRRLSAAPDRIRLLFEFWARGSRDPEVGRRMRQALQRYREAFGVIGRAVLAAEPRRFEGVTPEGLATMAVSVIKGCAVQAMIDPDGFEIAQHLVAARSLVDDRGPRSHASP